jgi:predicted ATPase
MVLAASREPLQLQGLPVPESADLATLEASSAARLFLQRARQAGGGTLLRDDEREAVRQICRLVDGLPPAS